MIFKDFHRNVKIRIAVYLAFGIAQFTTFPFMAVYFDKYFGLSITGLLLTISMIASLFSGAVGGFYADRIGRKKLMVMSEAVFLISYLVMAFANSPWLASPLITFIAYLVNNVCWGVYGPADEAMLLDVTTAENRQLMYSIFYWLTNLTLAIGASIGALLFESYRFELFTVMAIVVLGSLLVTIFFIQETFQPPQHHHDPQQHIVRALIHNYLGVLKDKAFMFYFVAGTLVMSVEFQLTNGIGIHLAKTVQTQSLFSLAGHSLQVDGIKMIGFLQTENTVLVVLLAALAARWIKRYPDKWVLFFGITLNTVGYSVMSYSSTPLILFIAMLFATIGEVSGVPIRQAYLGDIAPEHARSSYVAVNGMAFSLARVLSSGGVALSAVMPAWGMGVISLFVGMTGFLFYYAVVPEAHARRNATSVQQAVVQ